MTNQNSQPPVVIVQHQKGPGCLVQALWFIFLGWWLGGILISIAWILNITIIGLPLGMSILNNIPKILALQEPQTQTRTVATQGRIIVSESEQSQLNFWIRAAYFVFIGWWWSGIWLTVAYFLCGTIILIPIGLNMFRATPAMTTLRKY